MASGSLVILVIGLLVLIRGSKLLGSHIEQLGGLGDGEVFAFVLDGDLVSLIEVYGSGSILP